MKQYKSTIEAFLSAKDEIEKVKNDTQAYGFKYANLIAIQEEVNRVIKDKGLNIVEMTHKETEHQTRNYTNNKGNDTTDFISFGYAIYKIGSNWDDKLLTFEVPAVFSNNKSPHDATYSANSISYRYFLMRAFGIPTIDEDKAREEDKKIQESNKVEKRAPLKDMNGNIIWEPTIKQINLFRFYYEKNEGLKALTQSEMSEMKLNSVKDYIIAKGKEWFNKTVEQYINLFKGEK